MTITPAGLFAALAGAPSLPGARCRGRSHLFDPAGDHEPPPTVEARHNQALGLCAHCPSLDRCAAWVDSLPKTRRPEGVIAGRLHRAKQVGPTTTGGDGMSATANNLGRRKARPGIRWRSEECPHNRRSGGGGMSPKPPSGPDPTVLPSNLSPGLKQTKTELQQTRKKGPNDQEISSGRARSARWDR